MNRAELLDKYRAMGPAGVKAYARKLAEGIPELAEYSQGDLEKLGRFVIFGKQARRLEKEVDLAGMDYAAARGLFLDTSSRTGSKRTRDLYRRALDRLEAWCDKNGIAPLELTPATADEWIKDLRGDGRAAGSVRLDVSAASSFFSYLERWHPEIRNPFRGTRARPAKKVKRELVVPTDAEVAAVLATSSGQVRGAAYVLGYLGLRIGGLPGFSIRGERWTTTSKGKEISGPTPATLAAFAVVRKELERLGLSLRRPFADSSATKLSDKFKYLVLKMVTAGQLQNAYSVHDLRHHFAVELYLRTKDIYAVSRALGHASVAVTEQYLRSLDAIA